MGRAAPAKGCRFALFAGLLVCLGALSRSGKCFSLYVFNLSLLLSFARRKTVVSAHRFGCLLTTVALLGDNARRCSLATLIPPKTSCLKPCLLVLRMSVF